MSLKSSTILDLMDKPLSGHALAILEFVKAHPGVQAKYIVAGVHLVGQDFAKALRMLRERGLIEGKLDSSYDTGSSDRTAIRYFAKL